MFSDTFLAHFLSPYNAGPMEAPDAVGCIGDPECGDSLELYLRIEENRIIEVKFMVFGCAGAIATSSMTTILAKGKTLDQALLLKEQDVIDALGGIPDEKAHCSNLGIKALHQAIESYSSNKQ